MVAVGASGARARATRERVDAVTAMRIEPQPPIARAELAPSDVVIAVRSSAAHWVDLLMASGQYQHQPPPPYT